MTEPSCGEKISITAIRIEYRTGQRELRAKKEGSNTVDIKIVVSLGHSRLPDEVDVVEVFRRNYGRKIRISGNVRGKIAIFGHFRALIL